MRNFVFAAAVVSTMACHGVACSQQVVVPGDTHPFEVTLGELVRIEARDIAGASIKAEMVGPARFASVHVHREVREGRSIVGPLVKEFVVAPNARGSVIVRVFTRGPQPDAAENVTTYRFTVR